MWHFVPFRLDTVNQCLWRGKTRIPLRPKAFAILSYLVQNAGRLVGQDELLRVLWPDTFVQPHVLKSHILEIRAALGDNPKHPTFIETLPRRGYCFIKKVSETDGQAFIPNIESALHAIQIIGRERELGKLRHYLDMANAGERQVVLVSGEAGIGKTTLVDAFTRNAMESIAGIRIARGQCVEGYGVQEPYYPVLVALGKLLREDKDLIQLFATQAPTWLVQFPGLLRPEDRQTLEREILGSTRQRMVRELCDILPLMAEEQPLVLLLEDIHWADSATVDLVAAIAHSRIKAAFLLIATYRPSELALSHHPLKQVIQDLALHRLCHELAITPMGEAEVAQYLCCATQHSADQDFAAQSPGRQLPDGLAELMHRISDGNPLFLRAALDHMLAKGHLSCAECWRINTPLDGIELEVPESLRQMLELQVDRLSPEQQRALEAASVCGVSFLAQVAASVAEFDLERYEEICQNLTRHNHILRAAGSKTLPNGTAAPRCQFVHAFYRRAIYDRLPAQRRARFHSRAGESLETLYAETPGKMASELALHFEAGQQWDKAMRYLQLSAGNKGQRFAYREAAADLEHALELMAKLPAGERSIGEIDLMQKLGAVYFALEDFPRSVAILDAVAKRAALSQDSFTEISALIQMGIVLGRTSTTQAVDVVNRLFALCEREQDPILQARARMGALVHRLVTGGAKEQDGQQFRDELEKVRGHMNGGGPIVAAHTAEYSLFHFFFSKYQDGIRSLDEILPVLIEAGDIRHRAGLIILIMSLIFSGDWGKALRVIQDAIATELKNGNTRRESVLRLYQAWLHLFAQDWSGSLELCEASLPVLKHPSQSTFLHQALILAGTALVGLGRHEAASKYLAQAGKEMDAQPVALDWYWKMPLHSALTEVALRRGDLEQARVEAQNFVQTSLATAERTWQALAWEARARVSLADSNVRHSQECIRKSIAAIHGFDAPLALWRVHATAAQLLPESADDHHRLSQSGIRRLAESLGEFPLLREKFLSESERSAGFAAARFHRAAG